MYVLLENCLLEIKEFTRNVFIYLITLLLHFPVLQEGSGNDLAMLMLECFQAAKIPVGDDALDKIRSIFELYEPGSLDRYEFMRGAIK